MPGQFSASRSCASPLSPARQVSAVPVSYTHLDVYKRQDPHMENEGYETIDLLEVLNAVRQHLLAVILATVILAAAGFGIDVYKRQILSSASGRHSA